MSTTHRALTLFLLGLLSVSTHCAAERASRYDGRWQASYTTSPDSRYEMEFSGDRFDAARGEEWYKGQLVIDAEADPPRIDFVIEECECGFLGKTSQGIFRWDGDAIEIRAPQPGGSRPTAFDEKSGETMRLVREAD